MGQNKRKQRTWQLQEECLVFEIAEHIKYKCTDLEYNKKMLEIGCRLERVTE